MSNKNLNDQTQGPIEFGSVEKDQGNYFIERFNYIPISPDLIDHVRRLDTLNVSFYFLMRNDFFYFRTKNLTNWKIL